MIQLESFKKWGGSFLLIMIILLIIYIVLVAYNNNVSPILSFLQSTPTDKGPLPAPGVNQQSLYVNKPAPSDISLNFDKVSLNTNKFSISFDCFLNGTYLSTDVPRVLMYFGKKPASGISNTNFKDYKDSAPRSTSIIAASKSDIPTFFQDTNFLVYADPVKNDINVAFVTQDTSNNKHVEFASTITNVDINNPFKITIVLNAPNPNGQFVEIYMNTKLLSTYKIKNTLKVVQDVSNNIHLYSPISFIGNTIQIGNIQYFDNIITSSQVRLLTNALLPAIFFQQIVSSSS